MLRCANYTHTQGEICIFAVQRGLIIINQQLRTRHTIFGALTREEYAMDPIKIPSFAQPLADWQKAAIDASLASARSALEGAEQLMRLNLATACATLEQQSLVAQEILAVKDPQQLEALRVKLAQTSMQNSASYAHAIYEIVSESQAKLTTLAQEQMSQLSEGASKATAAMGQGAPGADLAANALKSTMAASTSMLESLRKASQQFAELSETNMKAVTSSMFNSGKGK